ncbi:MAG: apolipoprotein N-acyltransferase [Cellvibrionaceae bacterium]|jgi:apolipoprotein N-acyltransferase
MRSSLLLFLSLLAGALTTLAIPPYTLWWLAIITLAVFAYNLHQQTTKKKLFLHAFLFGLGFFGSGASWVFVSIHEFGETSLPLAIVMTSLFVIVNALALALPFCGLAYFKRNEWRLLLGFPLFFVLSEWLRSWLFTGFPWLYLGYAHIDTPIVGWAPIGGVFFVSLIGAFFSSVLCVLCIPSIQSKIKILSALAVVMFWAEGKALTAFEWTQPSGKTITVGIVQPNIPQELKWSPEFREPTLEILTALSNDVWQQDLVLWPEAAIPDVFSHSKNFLDTINQKALKTNTSLITGILYDDRKQKKYLNSLVGLGNAEGIYFKQRLVPFGEYVPLETYLRGLINFFNLPTSIIAKGDANQNAIRVGDQLISSAICYEIVYPALVAEETKNTNMIITVSNDSWFGKSIGPLQHFHMARMRAVETGRYVVRSTNNGVSAIIDNKGNIQGQSEQFIRTTLSGEATPMKGNTPFLIWKNYFLLSLLLTMIIGMIKFNWINKS